jgi:regulator of protease activity HflC (stomatin/prohibitin superfamily)
MYFHLALTLFILILLASAVKVCQEYERALVFRLGRLILPPKGPGIFLIIPVIDKMFKINLRSEKDLGEAERFLWEAKTQENANQIAIERLLSELADIRKNLHG